MFLRFALSKPIKELEEGNVHVFKGEVTADKLLIVPGSDEKCVFFNQYVDKWQRGTDRGKGRKMWVPQGNAQKCDGFYVSDGSGKIWVDGVANAMVLYGGQSLSGKFGKKGQSRFVARMVKEGDIVKIKGQVCKRRKRDPEADYIIRPDKKGVLKILVLKSAG